jgi:hypothetical protein
MVSPEVKPGFKTSEGIMAFLVVFGNTLLASGFLVDQPEILRVVEVVVGLLTTAIYIIYRTKAKSGG